MAERQRKDKKTSASNYFHGRGEKATRLPGLSLVFISSIPTKAVRQTSSASPSGLKVTAVQKSECGRSCARCEPELLVNAQLKWNHLQLKQQNQQAALQN